MSTLRVLYIDDEPDICEVVSMSLGLDPEIELHICASGKDGIIAVAEIQPDLILLDVMMPLMDGPMTLGILRENPKTSDIPVIFMTASVHKRELERFKSLGVTGVIAKPFDPITLPALVRSHMQSAPAG